MRDELQKQLAALQPNLKPYQVTNCVNKYVDAVIAELARQYAAATSEDIESGELEFAADLVNKACAQVAVNGSRVRVYTLMQQSANTSLVLVTYKGNSTANRVSKITLNPKYRKDIFIELANTDFVHTSDYLDSLEQKANYSVAINMATLDSYIKATRETLNGATGDKYIAKLLRNLNAATSLKQRAIAQADGSYIVKEYWEEIDSGRVQGYGLSLQRIAKEVRHAALGPCTRIDFKASSYAILTSLALAINPQLKVEALKHYVKHRSTVRKRIAKEVGVSEDRIKTVFTAIGFGAKVSDNPYNSINKLLGKDAYAKLIANAEFVAIREAFSDVCKTILANELFKGDCFSVGAHTYNNISPKTQTKRTKNQKLAWLYQACERMALDMVIDKMPSAFVMQLPVHDCMYLQQPLPAHVALDLKTELRTVFELLDFEQEKIMPIHARDDHSMFTADWESAEAEHRQHTQEAERDAVGYQSVVAVTGNTGFTATDYTGETNAQYEQRRRRTLMMEDLLREHKREAQEDE